MLIADICTRLAFCSKQRLNAFKRKQILNLGVLLLHRLAILAG
jgi:hypothetical protein